MTESLKTYLPLYKEDGNLIPRPDYLLLAALSAPDLKDMQHIYEVMLRESELNPQSLRLPLTGVGRMVDDKFIGAAEEHRFLTGAVVLELARLAAATGKPPSVNAARRLVSFRLEQEKPQTKLDSIKRELERTFQRFRNTAHLQAVFAFDPNLLGRVEGSEENTLKFLGLARGFEIFIDETVVSKSFSWSPVRVPAQIDAITQISFKPLSEKEIRIAEVV